MGMATVGVTALCRQIANGGKNMAHNTRDHAMNLWSAAADHVDTLGESDGLTIDQQLKIAEIRALLAIGRELSLIQHQGIRPEWISRTFGPTARA